MLMEENRVEKAVRLFQEEGHNCAQSVFAAYADKYGIDARVTVTPPRRLKLQAYSDNFR